jgi:hypothetical protein
MSNTNSVNRPLNKSPRYFLQTYRPDLYKNDPNTIEKCMTHSLLHVKPENDLYLKGMPTIPKYDRQDNK